MVRPVERYIHSAKIEADIILDILRKDNNQNISKCVKLEEYFYFSDKKYTYIVLAFERLGKSLYEFIKHNNYRGKSISKTRLSDNLCPDFRKTDVRGNKFPS